jgi:hypothetical protein
MAKYYQARQDVSIPRVVSTTGEGDDATHETEGVNYNAGSMVRAEDMTPRDRKRAESGELEHLLIPLDEDQARQLAAGGEEPEFGVFIAEHEAEAHALEAYGHQVVPADQALEAASASAEHARAYQEAVKEHGLDRRPAQEAMAQDRERVPDEWLQGAETRSGLPHNRGPAEQQGGESEQDDGDDGSESSESTATATRPRPGAENTASDSDSQSQAQ